jgi:hypothetical protein
LAEAIDVKRPAAPRASWRSLVLGAALAAALVIGNVAYVSAFLGFRHGPNRVKESDHRIYIAMTRADAGDTDDAPPRTAPFCWRVLVPELAALLVRAGASVDTAYLALTTLALWGWLLTLFVLLRQQGFDEGLAGAGLVLAALTPAAARWYAYQYWMTDPLSLWTVAAGILLVERRRWRWLAVLGVAGVLTRETFVLVYVWALPREWSRAGAARAWRRVGAAAVPAAAALIALRLMLPAQGGGDWAATLRFVLGFRLRHLLDNQIYFATLGTFGVLLPLALAGLMRWRALDRPRLADAAFVGATAASLLLAVNTDRLLIYALPVVLLWAVHGLRELLRAGRAHPTSVVVIAVAVQALFYAVTRFGPRAISIYQPTSWRVILACTAFMVWALATTARPARANA